MSHENRDYKIIGIHHRRKLLLRVRRAKIEARNNQLIANDRLKLLCSNSYLHPYPLFRREALHLSFDELIIINKWRYLIVYLFYSRNLRSSNIKITFSRV